MRIGTLFSIPVRLHSSFLLLGGYFLLSALFSDGLSAMVSTLVLAVGLFGSVVLHELGHALAARQYGIDTLSITLYPFGGVAALVDMPKDTRKELVIALAGPAVNGALFALALPAYLLSGWSVLGLLAGINLVMGLFNLVPAFPMDGGRVLRALLAERVGFISASKRASSIGWWFGVAFIGIGLVTWSWSLALVGAFVLFAGSAEQRRLQALLRRGWRPPEPGGHPQEVVWAYRPKWSINPS
ncbi:MAG: site-2 protease family protein [Proteobacteria bacterium]|nr:site-2 protease family protein [Pseudomonadota bacterium]